MRKINECMEEQKYREKRLFGKDITNQMKITEAKADEAAILGQKTQTNRIRVIRGKNQSMDEGLLKKNLLTGSNRYCGVFKENINTTNIKDVNYLNKINEGSNLNARNGSTFKNTTAENNLGSIFNPILKRENLIKARSNTNSTNNPLNTDTLKQTLRLTNKNNLEDSNVHMKIVSDEEVNITLPFNPLPHLDYSEEIYLNLLKEELSLYIDYDYMKLQVELNEKMRVILIEWIVDVVIRFKLRQDTFFLTVSLIDRYLSKKKIQRNYLQLLGATSLLVACKFEEIYHPEMRDIVYLCDKTFSAKEILAMELDILATLDFEIFPIFAQRCLQMITHFLNLSHFDMSFCSLMLELFTFDYKSNRYLPSLIACTSVYVALKIKKFSSDECNRFLFKFLNKNQNKSHYESEKEIKECAQSICFLLDNIDLPCFKRIKEKYSSKEFCEVAKFKIFN